MDLGYLNKVWEIKTLKKVGEDEARNILQKIAKQVQPVMRKHKWRVQLLSEFCPDNPSIMGLNVGGGVEINLRLRRPNRDWDFFPFDQILDTMLHELCHNVHGPHDANFYKLWDETRKECEELMAKGITGTGQGFDLPGRRLGGFSRLSSVSSLRQTALDAAENRARLGSVLPAGPKRLGGDGTIKSALTPIQAAAMAAERRLPDDIWCGSLKTSHPKLNSVDRLASPNAESGKVDVASAASVSGSGPDEGSVAEEPVMWECRTCTLMNPPLAHVCEVCNAEKPSESGTKLKSWSCKFCTLENSVKVDKCLACGQWRYSHGPPLATRPPYLGT